MPECADLPRRDVTISTGLIILRKEVIQPHVPVRLPCYDLVLLTNRTFGTGPRAS